MNPMSHYKKNIMATYSAQVVSVICNFICSILAARMLGATGQGELALYVSFSALMILLLGLGLPSAIVYFLAGNKLAKGKVIPLVISLTLVLLTAFGLMYFLLRQTSILSIFLPDFIIHQNLWSVVLFVHLLLQMINQYLVGILQAENNFKQSGLITAAGSLLLLGLYTAYYVGLIPALWSPIYWILASLLLVAGVQYFIFMLLLYKHDKAYFQFIPFSLHEIKPIWVFASLAFMANVVQFLNYKMDLWLINFYHHNKEMIGVYSLAVGLAQLLWLLPNAVHSVLYTFTSGKYTMQEKTAKTAKTSAWLLLYALVAGVIGYILSIYLVPYLFGSAFQEVPSIIALLLLGIIPLSGALALSAYFAGIHKIHINLYGSCIGLMVSLLLNILLIPTYGIRGAAISSILSYVSTALYYYILFFKHQKVNR